MSTFIKNHETLFIGLIALLFLPFFLQILGIINIFNFQNDIYLLVIMGVLAIIPVVIWVRIFNKENPEEKSTIILAFLAGCTSTIPVFFYQNLFLSNATGNFIFFKAEAVNFQANLAEMFGYSSFSEVTMAGNEGVGIALAAMLCVFLGVGILEEVAKQAVINPKGIKYLSLISLIIALIVIVGHFTYVNLLYSLGMVVFYTIFLTLVARHIQCKSIDDVIEIAIMSALGFAFIENIIYFIGKWGNISTFEFIFFVCVRVTVVTVVHVLCSGILAYHLGLAHFAGPVLRDEIQEGRRLPFFIPLIHKWFSVPEENIFFYEQVWVGLFSAVLIHAVYDFTMQLQWKVFGLVPLFALVMPIYFVGGLWYLFSLLDDKEDHKNFGKMIEKREYQVLNEEQIFSE